MLGKRCVVVASVTAAPTEPATCDSGTEACGGGSIFAVVVVVVVVVNVTLDPADSACDTAASKLTG